MAERMGIIVAIAFLFTRLSRFRGLLEHSPNYQEKVLLAFIFGGFGILGTYTGITISPGEVQHQFPGSLSYEDAIANSRAIGVMVAGLLGGPISGIGAGLLAGVHRVSLGGFTATACGVSTIFEGLIAGLVYKKFQQGSGISVQTALFTGIAGEVGQMIIIILIAQPLAKASALVEIIALPMILANSLGIALFIAILHMVLENDQRIGSIQAQKSLSIADKTLSHLRTGLNYQSAQAAAQIIKEETAMAAVALTDDKIILAHVGQGSDHHQIGSQVLTAVTKEVLDTGKLKVASSPSEILCQHKGCPLQSAIVVPLNNGEKIIGTLKLYFSKKRKPDKYTFELARGLGQLFSTQLELGAVERQARLLQDAEIKALQAQINPHFLFNSLNTVISLIRTNPSDARKVLIELGNYIRQNLKSSLSAWNTFDVELKHVQAYLAVVQARYSNQLEVNINVPTNLYNIKLPPLTLQPLVENAVQHGFKKITDGSTINIYAEPTENYIKISVQDNGIGIEPEIIQSLFINEKQQGKDRIGLNNVNGRLTGIFGPESHLDISSSSGKGTKVTFKIPK